MEIIRPKRPGAFLEEMLIALPVLGRDAGGGDGGGPWDKKSIISLVEADTGDAPRPGEPFLLGGASFDALGGPNPGGVIPVVSSSSSVKSESKSMSSRFRAGARLDG